jgi:hypothetical protein
MAELFKDPAVENFGMALRISIREHQDYASLVELKYAEREIQFAESITNFLRRYDSRARRYEREKKRIAFRPSKDDLDRLMELVEKNGVKAVSAALISHALVKVGGGSK